MTIYALNINESELAPAQGSKALIRVLVVSPTSSINDILSLHNFATWRLEFVVCDTCCGSEYGKNCRPRIGQKTPSLICVPPRSLFGAIRLPAAITWANPAARFASLSSSLFDPS